LTNKKKKAVVVTWGCTHNQKDSQIIESKLLKNDYQLISKDQIDNANLLVFNTCTVKTPTENKIIDTIDKTYSDDKEIYITGCLAETNYISLKKRYPKANIIGIDGSTKFENKNLLFNENIILPLFSNINSIEKPLLESNSWNPYIQIVQINEGCVNNCSFCATKFARGHLRSFSQDSIIQSIRSSNAKEIWLTSQDTGCWGFDNKTNLASLLEEINKIDRKLKIRVGMGNPNNFIKFLNDLVMQFQEDNVYKFLHLPLQSGSDRILKHMKRGYTVAEFYQITDIFKENFSNYTLATDIICGYPTETDSEFDETIAAIKRTKPSITNISKFWKRKNTPASKLKQIERTEINRRSKELALLCNEIQLDENKKWLGWKGEVIFTEMGIKGGIQSRNFAYKPIVVEDHDELLGKRGIVKIVESNATYFKGNLLEILDNS